MWEQVFRPGERKEGVGSAPKICGEMDGGSKGKTEHDTEEKMENREKHRLKKRRAARGGMYLIENTGSLKKRLEKEGREECGRQKCSDVK